MAPPLFVLDGLFSPNFLCFAFTSLFACVEIVEFYVANDGLFCLACRPPLLGLFGFYLHGDHAVAGSVCNTRVWLLFVRTYVEVVKMETMKS